VLVALREVAGGSEVAADAVDVEGSAGEGVLETALDQRDGEVGDFNADPSAAELLGCVNCGAGTAEGIEDDMDGPAGAGYAK
jgi:hypothetical protein